MKHDVVDQEFWRILDSEFKIAPPRDFQDEPQPWWWTQDDAMKLAFVKSAVEQMREVAINGTVLRSYIPTYMKDSFGNFGKTVPATDFHGNSSRRILAPEGDGSHTNLMQTIVHLALVAKYGPDFGFSTCPLTADGFEYPHIVQAVTIHELPENYTGDTPDNGARDQIAKDAFENQIIHTCTNRIAIYNHTAAKQVYELLSTMEQESTAGPTGRLLYMCDKFSCNFIVLTYDQLGHSPKMATGAKSLSKRDILEMEPCYFKDQNNSCLASEMWAVDMLRLRQLTQYDDTGFIRACLIMYTLMAQGQWYPWREDDYRQPEAK